MKQKQISGGVVLSFFSQIITIIVGLVYTPVMTRILGQSEYGLYQLVLSVVNYLNLMNFGFNGAYIRYYSVAKAKDDEKEIANVNGMFFNVFLIIAILCLVAGIVLYFNISILGSQLTESDYLIARRLLILMIINLALSFPNSLFVAFMSANEQFIFQKGLNVIFNILVPILNLPLLLLGFGSVGIVTITLLLTVVRFLINAIYCLKKLNMKISVGYFDKAIFTGLLGYTFFIFLSDLVDQLNSNVDKFLLGRITGTIAVAIYSMGYNLKYYYTIVSWIVPEMYIPEVNRIAIEEKSDKKLTELFTKIGRFNNYLLLLVLSAFILIGRQFIYLWIGAEYDISYYAAIILMLAGYIPAVQTLGTNIQNAKNMHRMRSIVYFCIACANVLFSIFLIRQWGVIGTCVGTLIATILGHGFFMNYYYRFKLNLQIGYFWKELFKWTLPVCGLFLVAYYFTQNIVIESWYTLFIFIIIYTMLYGALLWIIGINKSERNQLIGMLKKFLKKDNKL